MRYYKDLRDMTKDELEEYLDDISSGYAFDPDNEILDSDKNLSVKELFSQLAADANFAQFKSMHEIAAIISRVHRICTWIYSQIDKTSNRLNDEFAKKLMEHRENEGEY